MAERLTVLVRPPDPEWDRAASGVRCIPRVSIRPVRLDRVLECLDAQGSECRVQELALRRAWLLRQAQEIVHRVDTRSGVGETIATKSRRKVR